MSLCIHELVLSFIYILILLHIWRTCFELLKDKAFPRQHNFLLSMSKNLNRIWNTMYFCNNAFGYWILHILYKTQWTWKVKLMYWGNVYISNSKKHNMVQLSLDYDIEFFNQIVENFIFSNYTALHYGVWLTSPQLLSNWKSYVTFSFVSFCANPFVENRRECSQACIYAPTWRMTREL